MNRADYLEQLGLLGDTVARAIWGFAVWDGMYSNITQLATAYEEYPDFFELVACSSFDYSLLHAAKALDYDSDTASFWTILKAAGSQRNSTGVTLNTSEIRGIKRTLSTHGDARTLIEFLRTVLGHSIPPSNLRPAVKTKYQAIKQNHKMFVNGDDTKEPLGQVKDLLADMKILYNLIAQKSGTTMRIHAALPVKARKDTKSVLRLVSADWQQKKADRERLIDASLRERAASKP
ncbi:MAG: hypothetical protein OXE02_04580 [Chloroflexi bacterium]|nr:hypothetical protein [Chloroflexota bacterium]